MGFSFDMKQLFFVTMPVFKSIIVACICCFFAITSTAQDRFEYYKNRIKIAPLRAFYHPFEPGLELSYERVFHPRWSVEVTGNRIYAVVRDTNFFSRKGWAFGGELRYHFNAIKSDHFYLALGSSFSQSITEAAYYFHPKNMSVSPAVNDSLDYKDDFTLHRKTTYFTIRCGKIFSFDHFLIELSCGISIIHRDSHHIDRLFPDDGFAHKNSWSATFRGLHEGYGWSLRLPLQFKVSYAFGKQY